MVGILCRKAASLAPAAAVAAAAAAAAAEPAWAAARVVACAVFPPVRCAAGPGWPPLLPLPFFLLGLGVPELPRPRPGAPDAGGDPGSMIGIPEVVESWSRFPTALDLSYRDDSLARLL